MGKEVVEKKIERLATLLHEASVCAALMPEANGYKDLLHIKTAIIEALRLIDYELIPALNLQDVDRCLEARLIDKTGGKLYPEVT